MVREEWLLTAEIRKQVVLDEFVIMPDHIHGLIGWVGFMGSGTSQKASRTSLLKSGSLGAILGQFKAQARREFASSSGNRSIVSGKEDITIVS